MIVKVKSFKQAQFGNLLEYMTNEKKRLFDEKGRSFAITRNLKGHSISRWEKQFRENESFRNVIRKDSVILTHEILSWHKDDAENITLEKMQDIANEYIRQRNPNGLYVAVPHFDKEHYHIHICASGVEYHTGKSLRISKEEFAKLKKDIQNYQLEKYPELSNSSVAHGKQEKSRVSDKEYQMKQRNGRDTQKEQLVGILKTCYKKANSKEDFYNLLRESGLTTYERGGRIYGVVYGDTKHRFKGLGYEQKNIDRLDVSNIRERGEREKKTIEPTIKVEKMESKSRVEELQALRENQQNQSKEAELTKTKEEEMDKTREEELKEVREEENDKSDDRDLEK